MTNPNLLTPGCSVTAEVFKGEPVINALILRESDSPGFYILVTPKGERYRTHYTSITLMTSPPETPTKFLNPYAEIPETELHRTTIQVPKAVYAALQSVRPGAVLQTTINILLSKLIHELELTGLLGNFAPDTYESAVAGAVLTLDGVSRSPVAQPPAGPKRNRTKKAVKGDD